MYIPHQFAIADDEAIRSFVAAVASAELITTGTDGYPLSTLLPIIWDGDRLVAHMARGNPHWRQITPDSPALVVVRGPQTYVSPSWYASKAEHGRVVPTWNYSAVQMRGRVTVHDDAAWVRDAVSRLTDLHESPRDQPWAVTDAPSTFIDGQLKAIVGIEVAIESVAAKAKWSQNRDEADQAGVVDGLNLNHATMTSLQSLRTASMTTPTPQELHHEHPA